MSTMRPAVLHVITHLALGGAENVALRMIEALHETYAFEVFAVLEEGNNTPVGREMVARLARLSVPVHFGTRIPFKRGGVLLAACALGRQLRRRRWALVHVHTEIPELTLAQAIALVPGGAPPVLRTVHNARLWDGWGGIGNWTERRLRDAAVAGVSEAALSADDALRIRAGVKPAAAGRRVLVYNGVPEPAASVKPEPRDVCRILYAGRFEPQKGADLIPAILKAAAAITTVRAEVVLAGGGSLEPGIAAGIADPATRWPVRIIPGISALGDQIGKYDVVLMPSRFEGLGLVAIEALFAGVPVVATQAPGLVEVVPADDPLSCPVDDVGALANALAACLADPARFREAVAARLPALRVRFGVPAMAAGYRALYRTVAQS